MLALIDMTDHLIAAGIVLLIGGFVLRIQTRRHRDRKLITFVAFLLGPLLTVVYLGIEVYLLDPSRYARHPEDAWALIAPMMFIGVFVGVVSALGFLMILTARPQHKDRPQE